MAFIDTKIRNQAKLTIRKHSRLPVLQDLVELLSKLLVARVTEQVILPALGVEMLVGSNEKEKNI